MRNMTIWIESSISIYVKNIDHRRGENKEACAKSISCHRFFSCFQDGMWENMFEHIFQSRNCSEKIQWKC